MSGFIDLHCHCIPGIDDGARNIDESVEILGGLSSLGFTRVVTTPHMRPGMFDNTAATLAAAFELFRQQMPKQPGLPVVELSCEHFFDDVVFRALMDGKGIPYPGGRSILLEFYATDFPLTVDHRLADLRRRGYLPVIAHPERYEPLWKSPDILERLLDVGCMALLDAGALVGRYGKKPQRCARDLLDRGLYRAACSDSHRMNDVKATAESISWIMREYGKDELNDLFSLGPQAILQGLSQKDAD
jgi:protein-tyrosine phosphatase